MTTSTDMRQLERMAERLASYTSGQISLRALIADLELLLSTLEALDESIRQQLQGQWEILEEHYSAAMALRGGKLDAHAESSIQRAVTELRAQIAGILATPIV